MVYCPGVLNLYDLGFGFFIILSGYSHEYSKGKFCGSVDLLPSRLTDNGAFPLVFPFCISIIAVGEYFFCSIFDASVVGACTMTEHSNTICKIF